MCQENIASLCSCCIIFNHNFSKLLTKQKAQKMIVNCIQKGPSFYIYRDTGAPRMHAGFLVSFSGTTISYVSSPNTQTVIVIDENGHRIKSFCAPKRITEGIGWKK